MREPVITIMKGRNDHGQAAMDRPRNAGAADRTPGHLLAGTEPWMGNDERAARRGGRGDGAEDLYEVVLAWWTLKHAAAAGTTVEDDPPPPGAALPLFCP